jgi:hypothetical protein
MTNIGFFVVLIETGAVALVLASCGEKPEPRVPVAPTPTQAQLQEPDQGDEEGVRVVVGVRVTRGAVRTEPQTVAAFLPLRFSVTNETKRRVVVRITGQAPLPIAKGLTARRDSRGEKPGRLRISAGGRHATVRVKPGG